MSELDPMDDLEVSPGWSVKLAVMQEFFLLFLPVILV